MIKECAECLAYSTCKICQIPVLAEGMEQHHQEFMCRPVKEGTERCPLCAQDLKEPVSLLFHLTTRPGCPESTRKFKRIPVVKKEAPKVTGE